MIRLRSCPTCGGYSDHPTAVRLRAGGIARIRSARWFRGRGSAPTGSVRVYWPPSRWGGSYVQCPDSWHRAAGRTPMIDPAPAEPAVNVHERCENLNGRRKQRAQLHRRRQAKDRR
jgi:hypothetical protein